MGMRQRIHPRLPQEYLGVAVRGMLVKIIASELLNNGLGWAAWQINQMIASQMSDEVREFLVNW